MSRRVVLERHAEEDLAGQAEYIARDNPLKAIELLDAVERAFARLAEFAEIGSPRAFQHTRLTGIRMWPVPEFSDYLIFYRVSGDTIQVLRILRAAQDYTRFFRETDAD